jgi:hypothetical protein
VGKPDGYEVVLTDGGPRTYANTKVLAVDDADAVAKARDWAAALESRWDDAWLILNIGSRLITLKPGDF